MLRIDKENKVTGLRNDPGLLLRSGMKKIEFESDLAKELYMEVSALADMKKVDRPYISLAYIWKVWKKVYRMSFGSTRHVFMPGELRGKEEPGEPGDV